MGSNRLYKGSYFCCQQILRILLVLSWLPVFSEDACFDPSLGRAQSSIVLNDTKDFFSFRYQSMVGVQHFGIEYSEDLENWNELSANVQSSTGRKIFLRHFPFKETSLVVYPKRGQKEQLFFRVRPVDFLAEESQLNDFFIMRHAPKDEEFYRNNIRQIPISERESFDRHQVPLSEEGIMTASDMGKSIVQSLNARKEGVPSSVLILSSPYLRCQQTAQAVKAEIEKGFDNIEVRVKTLEGLSKSSDGYKFNEAILSHLEFHRKSTTLGLVVTHAKHVSSLGFSFDYGKVHIGN